MRDATVALTQPQHRRPVRLAPRCIRFRAREGAAELLDVTPRGSDFQRATGVSSPAAQIVQHALKRKVDDVTAAVICAALRAAGLGHSCVATTQRFELRSRRHFIYVEDHQQVLGSRRCRSAVHVTSALIALIRLILKRGVVRAEPFA